MLCAECRSVKGRLARLRPRASAGLRRRIRGVNRRTGGGVQPKIRSPLNLPKSAMEIVTQIEAHSVIQIPARAMSLIVK